MADELRGGLHGEDDARESGDQMPQVGMTNEFSLIQWVDRCAELKAAIRGESDVEMIQAYAARVETLRTVYLDPQWAAGIEGVYERAERLDRAYRSINAKSSSVIVQRDRRLMRDLTLSATALWNAADEVFAEVLATLKANGQYYRAVSPPWSLGDALDYADELRGEHPELLDGLPTAEEAVDDTQGGGGG